MRHLAFSIFSQDKSVSPIGLISLHISSISFVNLVLLLPLVNLSPKDIARTIVFISLTISIFWNLDLNSTKSPTLDSSSKVYLTLSLSVSIALSLANKETLVWIFLEEISLLFDWVFSLDLLKPPSPSILKKPSGILPCALILALSTLESFFESL